VRVFPKIGLVLFIFLQACSLTSYKYLEGYETISYSGGYLSYQITPQSCEIFLDGKINEDLEAQLNRLLKKVELSDCTARWLLLKSSGGGVTSAMHMGQQLRDKNFNTQIKNAKCDSACGLLFISGAKRIISSQDMKHEAQMGFHQLSVEYSPHIKACISYENDVLYLAINDYTTRMLNQKASREYFIKMVKTDCQDINRVDSKVLFNQGIVTGFMR
jgi:hypothetical protein